jgi:DNA-binding XRE family transcriptional regulator
MERSKRRRLQKAGWQLGSVQEFLGLTDEEAALIEIRLALVLGVRKRRIERGLTQAELADLLGSSQSRVAKIEAGDMSVSIDLLIRALLALGVSRQEIGRIVSSRAA